MRKFATSMMRKMFIPSTVLVPDSENERVFIVENTRDRENTCYRHGSPKPIGMYDFKNGLLVLVKYVSSDLVRTKSYNWLIMERTPPTKKVRYVSKDEMWKLEENVVLRKEYGYRSSPMPTGKSIKGKKKQSVFFSEASKTFDRD
jgi:hypothetical protein